jgi:hypothetical protein
MTEVSTALPRLAYTVTATADTPVGQHLSTLAFRYGWAWREQDGQLTVAVETSPVATHLLLTDLLERAGDELIHIHASSAIPLHTWPGLVNAGGIPVQAEPGSLAARIHDYSIRPSTRREE